jgi:GNAT superfamily N-acetyltransferase
MKTSLILLARIVLTVTIRKYQEVDRDACRSLWRELTERHREIYEDPRIGGEHPERGFDKHLAKAGADNVWVAVHDSAVVGLTGLLMEKDETEIEPLIVSKTYRGRGIGKQLVEAMISEAKARGLKFLNVSPVARNVDTIRFLHGLGFRTLGFVQLFVCFSDAKWKSGPELYGCRFDY